MDLDTQVQAMDLSMSTMPCVDTSLVTEFTVSPQLSTCLLATRFFGNPDKEVHSINPYLK